jgi:solute:Na+ symporter, SSS family
MSELNFLNHLDFSVLGLYMLVVVGVGFYVARFNRGTVDYFKGGGHVPWKLSMLSLFISGFSAFMFVGASGIAYGNGGGALLLFSFALPAYLLGAWVFGWRWRRTRIDTPLQFLTRRFSQGTTYFYTLLAVVPNTLVLGIMIYTLCIFISTALGIGEEVFSLGFIQVNGFELTLLVTGAVIATYTTLGGLWAVMVTDAIQFLIVVLVTLVMTPLAYSYLGDGSFAAGVSRLFREAPEGYFAVNLEGKPPLFWLTWFIYIIFGYNVNWHIAQRYYSISDERDTRKMAYWCGALSFLLPMLWILPILTTPILFPQITELWPNLSKPSEASFVTLALTVLPHGMLGLLTAAIFAATMSSTDTLFNWLGAVLTKDVYVPLTRQWRGRDPSERTQLWVGKSIVGLLGLIAIWVAFNVQRYGGAFDVYVKAESLYKITLFVPVLCGLLYTRTPWWSAIAAVSAGVAAVGVVGVVAASRSGDGLGLMNLLFAEITVDWFGFILTRYELNALVGLVVSGTVFYGSAFFNRREGDFKARVEAHAAVEDRIRPEGLKAYAVMGWLAVLFGVLLLALVIPTAAEGGWLNGLVGGLALAVGVFILRSVRAYARIHFSTTNPPPSSHDPT